MDHLENISIRDLRRALNDVGRKRPTRRLMIAIAYANGVTQTELADWYGVERKTIYNWLTRFDESPGNLVEAARDEDRPGRPPKLTDQEQRQLEDAVRSPPRNVGYGASGWTPELVRRYVSEQFGVEYSRESCRRWLRDAGSDAV